VVITGIGVLAPNGPNTAAFWQNIVAGKSGIRRFSAFDAAEYPCKIAGEVVGFDPATYFRDAKSIRRSDRFVQFAMAASKMAMAESGLNLDQVDATALASASARESAALTAWRGPPAALLNKDRPASHPLPSQA
jgi:3-oxoacyl-[acyl-carrier-protein] synthase II